MKLPGSTKSKITENEHSKHLSHLEITKVVLLHCNIESNGSQQNFRVLYAFIPNESSLLLLDIHPKILLFKKLLIKNFQILK